ncbi:MAG: hypothetical protein A2170_07915 [Deltaproteobacteria bacterium RBG_13_53_10]|nr:MAG: hypothetical protein A2170_07915 [Deltaproteobacteria bacterium RBG_13_53_10]
MFDSFEDHCWKDVVSEEDLEVYRHYRREPHIGARPALLAIDLYNLVFDGGPRPVHEVTREFPSSCGVYAWDAVEPLKELFAAARSRKLPVIYTTSDPRRETPVTGLRATRRRREKLDDHSHDIKAEFKPGSEDLIIFKERASAFFGTPLVSHLVRRNIDTLVICGETTSGCVRASTLDAYSYGFHTVIVEECCFDRSLLSHKVNLFDMHHKYADVMHLEEVKRKLQEGKETP